MKALFKDSLSLPVCIVSHAWKICILEKKGTEVILVGWFSKCQSIKKVGGRRFVEGLYQALFSFRLARRNVITKGNENLAWSQVKDLQPLAVLTVLCHLHGKLFLITLLQRRWINRTSFHEQYMEMRLGHRRQSLCFLETQNAPWRH